MPTLDQKRAALAWEHGAAVGANKAEQKKYASIVYSVPMLVRSAGLSQALHFVQARGDKTQQHLLGHLAKQLQRVNANIKDTNTLLKQVREAELSEYLQLTHETLACLTWYKRYVQGVLGILPTEVLDGES